MKSYNFDDKDKFLIIAENFEEYSNLVVSLYSNKLDMEKYIENINNEEVIEDTKYQIKTTDNMIKSLEHSKCCNSDIWEYIDKECKDNNLDFMQFIHICLKSYMLQKDASKQFPSQFKRRKK